MKKIYLIILAIIISSLVLFWFFTGDKESEIQEEILVSSSDSMNERRDEIVGTEEIKRISKKVTEEIIIPENIKINVPFTSQAPFGVWDERHEEACEEASLLMIAKYLSGEKLNPKISEEEIQKMINFQVEKYGDYKDSNMEEVVKLAKDFYDIKRLEVIYDFEKEKIKEELARGNPIVVPTAGRLLGNPYFTSPGPLYHNLVLIGYDGNIIITNDPGTKRGKEYSYDIDILYNAIHDFTGRKADIEKGRKAMIIIGL